MRTTVTLEPDTAALVQQHMRERGISFKEAINELIRRSVVTGAGATGSFSTRTAPMGVPTVNLDRALQIAADLEDDELVRRSRLGK